ncbi:MAG: hypothetical protein IKO19_06400 [Candidatus Riflebacteria bacterium]|nr:hypothetical protein [Candidatus Riflebacteria bacterium]MBR4570283.1 hypothetical protein [Candidatus Riflebacteria bacterium]
MNKLFARSRKGMAVPVVLLIVLCVMVMTVSLFHFRKQSKQQNVSNFHFLRVNFLAQCAVQHMLLKLSVFPQEAYDSGVLSLGYCPFRGIIFGNNNTVPPKGNSQNKEKGLQIFIDDCNTDPTKGGIEWVIDKNRMSYADNKYKIDLLEVMSAYNNNTEKKTYLTSKIVGIGESKMEKGNAGFRKERLEKVIQLTGNN